MHYAALFILNKQNLFYYKFYMFYFNEFFSSDQESPI